MMKENGIPGWTAREISSKNDIRMRNLALQAFSSEKEPRAGKKERQRKHLRIALPPWLGSRASKDIEQMSSEFNEKARKE